MKRIVLGMLIVVGLLQASLVNDGFNAYNNGNKQTAIKLWSKACDGGDMDGCGILGVMYDTGDGIRQDKQKASKLYKKACDGGFMRGCKNYKLLNEEGI